MKHSILTQLSRKIPLSIFVVSLLFLGCFSGSIFAVNPPVDDGVGLVDESSTDPTDSIPTNKKKDCDDSGSSSSNASSLSWTLNIGEIRKRKQNDFLKLSRQSILRGDTQGLGMLNSPERIYNKNYGDSDLMNQSVYFRVRAEKITREIFSPEILKLSSPVGVEVILDSTQSYIRQVLSDNILTNIQPILGESGFHIQLWDITKFKAEKESVFYNLPEFKPMKEIFFKKPDGVRGNNDLIIVSKERLGARGEHVTTEHHRQDNVKDQLIIVTYEGEGINGSILKKEIITYSKRGDQVWDYSLEREVYTVTTNRLGVVDDEMNKIAHTFEEYEDFTIDPSQSSSSDFAENRDSQGDVYGQELPDEFIELERGLKPHLVEIAATGYTGVWVYARSFLAVASGNVVSIENFHPRGYYNVYFSADSWSFVIKDKILPLEIFQLQNQEDQSSGIKKIDSSETMQNRRLVNLIEDFEGERLNTSYQYYKDEKNPFIHGRLKSVMYPDGSWEYYEYEDSIGMNESIIKKFSSWKDVTIDDYLNGRKEESLISCDKILKTISVEGVELLKISSSVKEDEINESIIVTEKKLFNDDESYSAKCYYSDEISDSVPAECAGRLKWIEHPDGTASIYSYRLEEGNLIVSIKNGSGNRNEVIEGMETITIYNRSYDFIYEERRDVSTGFVLSTKRADLSFSIEDLALMFPQEEVDTKDSNIMDGLDGRGRAIKWIYNDNARDFEVNAHGCCGFKYSRRRDGSIVYNHRDALRRVYHSVYQSSSNNTLIHSYTIYEGLKIREEKQAAGVSLLVGESASSLSGLEKVFKAPDVDGSQEPEVSYEIKKYIANEGSTTTRINSDGGTTITRNYIDGREKSIVGTSVPDVFFDYGVVGLSDSSDELPMGSDYTIKKYLGSDEEVVQYQDQFNRLRATVYADGSRDVLSYYSYNNDSDIFRGFLGKIKSLVDADRADNSTEGVFTDYFYNSEGERVILSQSLPEGKKLLTETEEDVFDDSELGVCYRTRTWINGVLTNTSLRSGDGYRERVTNLAGVSLRIRTIASDGSWTVTSINADGQKTVQTYTNGQLATVELFDNTISPVLLSSKNYTYDGFDRLSSVLDSRIGKVTYDAYTESGSVLAMTDAGGRTTSYTYDSMGRIIVSDAPNTEGRSNTTYTAYYPTGQVKAQWGSQTYPRWYEYDEQNRMRFLHAYTTDPELELANIPDTPPATNGQTTEWKYDSQRGWLIEKLYPGELDFGPSGTADYTYTRAGRLKSRAWERGVVTNYDYDAGQLIRVTYSNEFTAHRTPDITYTYDDFGRIDTVSRGGELHADYDYDASTLQLTTEKLNQDLLPRTLIRHYDELLRPIGVEVLKQNVSGVNDPSSDLVEHAVSYGYDTAGRLQNVHSAYPLPAEPDFTYSYLAGSPDLVHQVTSPVHTVTNTYEPDRDVLDTKTNSLLDGLVVSEYNYQVNAIGQRENLATSGSAFTEESSTQWQYDSLGQVITAEHSTNPTANRGYRYDAIGNRKEVVARSTVLTGSDNYQTNAMNQYTQTPQSSAPVSYDLDGNLLSDGVKSYVWDAENRLVRIEQAGREVSYQYDYLGRRMERSSGGRETRYLCDGWNVLNEYGFLVPLANGGAGPLFFSPEVAKSYTWGLDLSGSMQGAGGVGGLLEQIDYPSTYQGSHYPSYDGNGNVTEYLDEGGVLIAHYEYDPFGNITKSSRAPVVISEGEDSGEGFFIRENSAGLIGEVSGGLLIREDSENLFSFLNLSNLLNSSTVPREGTNVFSYRFSTKPQDELTGLYYYGYRYYDPVTGRWPSRDPIGERGGVNLYQMVFNDPINWADMLGLKLICEDEESKKAIEEIRENSEKGRENIEQLEKSKHEHKVRTTTGNEKSGHSPNSRTAAGNFSGTGSSNRWNPQGENGFSGESVLAHELQHAADSDKGRNIRRDDNRNGIRDNEDRAVDAGNDYREGVGEDLRDDYNDRNSDPDKTE